MKKIAAAICLALLLLLTVFAVSAEGDAVSLDAVTIGEDGKTVTAHISLTEEFISRHQALYVFRVSADRGSSLTAMTPIAEQKTENRQLTVTVPYDADDPSAALYGYVLGCRDDGGVYRPVSRVVYPENFAEFAPHTRTYPTVTSKKGLQVQLLTDAQLLGVKHTVVNAFFNELIVEGGEKAVSFVYGNETYYLDAAALSALDYRIRSLSDAGIHIYLNYLLAYDPEASSELYYPEAEGDAQALYAPNVSSSEGIRRYAAVMHFLASRYSRPDGAYGFCGSYILGYEVNRAEERHRTGMSRLSDFAEAYAVLLRTADTAVRSAYGNGRVFVSLSHHWYTPEEEAEPALFGAKELLDELAVRCPDVPFGVSLNPYPSELSMTEYWKDGKATDSVETPFLTVKNLSVLTEYLKTEAMLYQGKPRTAMVGEFGLSGKPGEAEALQAAGYLLAYSTVCRNEGIESFIWHRHVDHAGEQGLYYGLYASSDLLLEPTAKKELYAVFAAVDADSQAVLEEYRALLPEEVRGSLTTEPNRIVSSVTAQTKGRFPGRSGEMLFDFSRSLYAFYPTDNARYLERYEENGGVFLRAELIDLSPKEYMGIGISLHDLTRLNAADSLTVRLRVTAGADTADLRLLLVGEKDGREIVLDGQSCVPCGEWAEVTFPLESFTREALSSCTMKLWARLPSGGGEAPYLDVASMTLHTAHKADLLGTALMILVVIALGCGVFIALYPVLLRRRKRRSV